MDRSQALISLLTVGLCLAALFAGARLLLSKLGWQMRVPAWSEIRRRFLRGWNAQRELFPVLVVMLVVTASSSLLTLQHWTETNPSEFTTEHRRVSAVERVLGDLQPRQVARKIIAGSAHVSTYAGSWMIGFAGMLAVSAWRRRFPFSGGPARRRYWLLLALILPLAWFFQELPWLFRTLRFSEISWRMAPVFLVLVLIYVLGFACFLLVVLANVSDQAEQLLASSGVPRSRLIARLVGISLVFGVFGTATFPFAFEQYLRMLRNQPSEAPLASAEWVWIGLGAVISAVAITSILPASSSETSALFLRRTLNWWKRDTFFLATLVVGVGLLLWLFDLLLDLSVPLPWGMRSAPAGLLSVQLRLLISAAGYFVVQVCAFSLLLGTWLETESAPQASEPPLAVSGLPAS